MSLHLQLLLHYEKKMHFALLDKVIFMTFKPYSSLAYHCSKNKPSETMWEFTQSQWNRKQNIGCKYWVYDLLFCKQVTIFNIHICPELRSSWTCKLLATLLLCQLVISLKAKSLFICFYLPNVLMTLDCNFVFLSSLLQCLLYFPFSQYFIIHNTQQPCVKN